MIKTIIRPILALGLLCLFVPVMCEADIYFPHVTTRSPWQTEIAVINTSSDQSLTGTLNALNNEGELIDTMAVTLSARGRRQITIEDEFVDHAGIGYIVFDTDSDAVQGYTKFFQEGNYRTAIPAVKEINTSDVYISHIASNDTFWTGISLVNTAAEAKDLAINFNDGRSATITINAGEHRAFTISSLFDGEQQPDIKSAVITNAGGIIGLELFGSDTQLDGLLLTDETVSTIYYPHVADMTTWWTGIVAYNTSEADGEITITPYSEDGTALATSTLPVAGQEKYVGVVKNLDLPDDTAWFKIDSTQPIVGFELFGTMDSKVLAAYAQGSGSGAQGGVFAKIEKSGWTGIAFVNTEEGGASVTLTAYNDNGRVIATQQISVGSHAKVVDMAEDIFSPQNISSATYLTYSSDKNVVGFQLNGSSDGKMLDGLPALAEPADGVCTDADGDGYYAGSGCGTAVDCDDIDPTIHPGAEEVCGDGIDNDCNWQTGCYLLQRLESDSDNDGDIDSIITHTFDAGDRLVTVEYDLDNNGTIDITTTATYDANGNMITNEVGVLDFIVSVTTYIYDGEGNLIKEEDDSNNDGTVDSTVSYTYDGDGNLIEEQWDNNNDGTVDGTISYTYDGDGNLIEEEWDTDNDGTVDRTIYHTYDGDGNMIEEEWDNDNDGTVDSITYNTYDGDGNMIESETDADNDGDIDSVSYLYYT